MIPNDLESKYITCPPTDDYSIVIITGNQMRHQQFALKLQEKFPHLVKMWIELDPTKPSNSPKKHKVALSKKDKILNLYNTQVKAYYQLFGFRKTIVKIVEQVKDKFLERAYQKEKITSEQKIFGYNFESLKNKKVLDPLLIHPSVVNSKDIINQIKAINPYFILTLGGPLYKTELLQCARGFAINQHAGHSPEYKGTRTTEWALYHRDINKVANTVHITSGGADDGLILRRSNPCIFPSDTIQNIIDRVIALGSELVIEVVEQIINQKEIQVFKQPKYSGHTFLAKDMPFHINKSSIIDFKNKWLSKALEQQRTY